MNPKDPRNNPGHRERGRKRYEYTYVTLGHLYGISSDAVRQAVYRGDLAPESLESICHYYAKRQGVLFDVPVDQD